MPEFDAFSPREIAQRLSALGVAKTRLPLVSLVMLGMLAGAFIGLGAMFNVIILSDASIPIALRRALGGIVFSMIHNWVVVCFSNFLGAIFLAWLVFLSGHPGNDGGAVAQTYLRIAAAKTSLPPLTAFASGVMCNVLVCTAVWVSLAGRSVVDKWVAIVLPIAAFVAAGFEHSIANMYLIPMGMMLQAQGGHAADFMGLARNLVPVIAGNLTGGSVLVALVYYVIYVRPRKPGEAG